MDFYTTSNQHKKGEEAYKERHMDIPMQGNVSKKVVSSKAIVRIVVALLSIGLIFLALLVGLSSGGFNSQPPLTPQVELEKLPDPKIEDPTTMNGTQLGEYAKAKHALLDNVAKTNPIEYDAIGRQTTSVGNPWDVARQFASDPTKTVADINSVLSPYFPPNAVRSSYTGLSDYFKMVLENPVVVVYH